MRQYQYHATDATIDALRRLRSAWTGYRLTDDALLVALADGGTVRVRVEGAVVEPDFEAFRLSAALTDDALEQPTAPDAFGVGRNDLVVFRSETWIDGPDASAGSDAGPATVMQFTGAPLQRSASAAAVCTVDDAIVVATSAGTGLLLRCGLRPYALEATTQPADIARFLAERRYGTGSSDA